MDDQQIKDRRKYYREYYIKNKEKYTKQYEDNRKYKPKLLWVSKKKEPYGFKRFYGSFTITFD